MFGKIRWCVVEGRGLFGKVREVFQRVRMLFGKVRRGLGRSEGCLERSDGCLGGSEGCLGDSEGCLGGSEGCLGGSEGCLGGSEVCLGGSVWRLLSNGIGCRCIVKSDWMGAIEGIMKPRAEGDLYIFSYFLKNKYYFFTKFQLE